MQGAADTRRLLRFSGSNRHILIRRIAVQWRLVVQYLVTGRKSVPRPRCLYAVPNTRDTQMWLPSVCSEYYATLAKDGCSGQSDDDPVSDLCGRRMCRQFVLAGRHQHRYSDRF